MSLNLFSRLMPPEESFTALFCEQAQRILEAARELRSMVTGTGSAEGHVAAIRAIEMAADEVAKRVFFAANRAFNAPIDREDILLLAHLLDDAVDQIEDMAKGIQRYDVRDFPAEMHKMVDAIVESAELLHQVMPHLDRVASDYKAIFVLCEKIGHIEGRADECFDRGLHDLRAQLRAGTLDTIGYIDRKELYEFVEDVVDKCDDIANTVQSITAKHV
jgi:predicted phosphate transport protein (TIGR00153 family)